MVLGGRAAVEGYSVGGKSGTSEPTAGNLKAGYVASFAAISPVENTKLVVLACFYDPDKSNHQGRSCRWTCCRRNTFKSTSLFRYRTR